MKLIKIICLIMIIILIGNIIFTWTTYFNLETKGEEIVKCYDRYSNEIIGQECIDDNDNYDDLLIAIFLTMLTLFVIAFVSHLYFMDI